MTYHNVNVITNGIKIAKSIMLIVPLFCIISCVSANLLQPLWIFEDDETFFLENGDYDNFKIADFSYMKKNINFIEYISSYIYNINKYYLFIDVNIGKSSLNAYIVIDSKLIHLKANGLDEDPDVLIYNLVQASLEKCKSLMGVYNEDYSQISLSGASTAYLINKEVNKINRAAIYAPYFERNYNLLLNNQNEKNERKLPERNFPEIYKEISACVVSIVEQASSK